MKVISLWQPYASLWCSGIKKHETRHWPTSHRGWTGVHAAKRRIDDLNGTTVGDICDSEFGHHYGLDLPRGGIVGLVHLVDCKRTEDVVSASFKDSEDYACGDFSPGRFAWRADKFELFDNPIPYRGQQGLFDVPDDIFSQLKCAA